MKRDTKRDTKQKSQLSEPQDKIYNAFCCRNHALNITIIWWGSPSNKCPLCASYDANERLVKRTSKLRERIEKLKVRVEKLKVKLGVKKKLGKEKKIEQDDIRF